MAGVNFVICLYDLLYDLSYDLSYSSQNMISWWHCLVILITYGVGAEGNVQSRAGYRFWGALVFAFYVGIQVAARWLRSIGTGQRSCGKF